mmetsp:Transcript_23703/g.50731  ORF Transcript_23703/g.50731 Transcript_23703/m.50731 type:complete len:428 (-) Transcript_23703:52-1335(-)|eukprot:CAMPEP_0172556292 /NCGR_PEP_ID=MMETSP1067-20121228/65192_1 /TAXON_ID=265564 ORGANISM="Thalassiosira punctigera, Strain Tpunct2005C2" /NCGR_SAMPLE_ID=MMETSP1067 /ASSEMBLY_ACC=CAM_ASM_000444 /LENGTH=427 /DNA_ID=CAMNT_0013345065 /DNA_START=42 /DNA_END=1325 /DNA_ORIENTATION=-
MPTLLSSTARIVWVAFIGILSHSRANVSAFAPSSPLTPLPELTPQTRASPFHCVSSRLPRRPLHRQCDRQPSRRSSVLRLGVEDIIFSAQNVGSSLANTVISSGSAASNGASSFESLKSLAILYTAGLWTSFSPCSLGLLPITVSYITNAAQERKDKETILPTLAFATGLALVFTALGVSASALGGVFGSSGGNTGGGKGGTDSFSSLLLAAMSYLVSVLMGLQLLELIRIPLPSLDFKWRSATAFESGSNSGGSLFDESGGLILDNLQSNQEKLNVNGGRDNDSTESEKNELAALTRICFLGGTSALVASPCATPVLASLLAYLASVSSDSNMSSSGDIWKGALWMLSYTLGYSTPLLVVGATGGQALVNLQRAREDSGEGFNLVALLAQWITPLTGGVLITFGMNGFLVALLGDPSMSALAPIID